MVEEPGTRDETSAIQMIDGVLVTPKLESVELTTVPTEAGEVVGTDECVTKEVPTDRGFEVGVHEAVKVDDEG